MKCKSEERVAACRRQIAEHLVQQLLWKSCRGEDGRRFALALISLMDRRLSRTGSRPFSHRVASRRVFSARVGPPRPRSPAVSERASRGEARAPRRRRSRKYCSTAEKRFDVLAAPCVASVRHLRVTQGRMDGQSASACFRSKTCSSSLLDDIQTHFGTFSLSTERNHLVYYDQGKTEMDLGPIFFDPTRPDPLSKQPNAIQSIDGPDPCPSLGGGGG